MNANEAKETFLKVVAQFCKGYTGPLTPELRFREDLQFTSLDFMSFLGELEDTFDIEIDEKEAGKITTVGEALDYIESLI